MLRALVCRTVALLALALPSSGFAAFFPTIYALGDSLSDQGNLFLATQSLVGTSRALPDAAHYFNGRFSNGPVYTDVIAQKLGVPLAPSILGGTNFAYGGARSSYNTVESTAGGPLPPGILPWSLNAEIAAFRSRGIFDPAGLYIVFSGSNDIADQIRGRNPTAAQTTLAAVLDAIDAFKAAGARRIVVPNVPDLGLTPIFAPVSAIATRTTVSYNALLDAALDAVTGVEIIEFDTFTAVRNIIGNPLAFGIVNTTAPCYSGFVEPNPAAVECANPDQFFFWDAIHPTRVVHALLGQAILAAAVPLPATLPLVGLALALLVVGRGFARRAQARG